MLANSQGQNLTDHLVGTMKMAIYCAEKLGIEDSELKEVIALSAFFHDIGKCTNYFQNITIKNKNEDGSNKEDKLFELIRKEYPEFQGNDNKDYYPRHNEVSWWYAARYAKKGLFKNIGLHGIYWHHATFHYTPFERSTVSIDKDFHIFDSEEPQKIDAEINKIIKSINFPFKVINYIDSECDNDIIMTPKFFVECDNADITNAQRWLVRSCVVCADHIISSLLVDELNDIVQNDCAEKYYSKYTNYKEKSIIDFKTPNYYDNTRFSIQKEIVDSCDRTTVVKAPAGFGKSLIGVMWGAKQKGQIYWVCPRNTVAEGVYQNILEEIKAFGLNLSVELFLTSERKNCTDEKIPDCRSDIIVTNIDNLIAPMVSHKHVQRIFDVNATNVVFDEFHEFLNDEALFSAFVVYMKARHLICNNAKTLLLSATPSIYHCLWEGEDKKVKILPNEETHFSAQHKKSYNFSFDDKIITNPDNSSLTMYSAIKNVQDNYNNNYDIIIHSNYSDDDRKIKMDKILTEFGKKGAKKGKIISAPILQAALDISFNTLYKTIESPEADIQTFGRVNRWGELNSADIVMLVLFKNKNENSAIKARYNLDLSKKWCDFLQKNETELSLDKIYELYNNFNKENEKDLKKFIFSKFDSSIKKLSNFYPKENRFQKDSKIRTGKTLRNSGASYFVVVKNKQTNLWENFIFNFSEHEVEDFIDKDRGKLEAATIKTVWENLNKVQNKLGEYVYNYEDLIKMFFGKKSSGKIYASKIKPYAKCSETPLPIWCKQYDSVLGLIDI